MSDDLKGAGAPASAASVPMEGIEHPGINDVMFGRGGDTNYHIGNHRFRVLADEHRHVYRSATRKEKQAVVQELVRRWRGRGGRFLAKTNPEKGDESLWNDVGDIVAKKKAAKILSEKAVEGKNKDSGGNNDRKRSAVDSVEEGRALKRPAWDGSALNQAQLATSSGGAVLASAAGPRLATMAGVGASGSLTAGGSSAIGGSPLRPSAAAVASLLQQQALPPPPPPAQLGSLGTLPFQSTLRQMLQLPPVGAGDGAFGVAMGGNVLGQNLGTSPLVRELLGIRSNPLAVSALAFAGQNPDLELTRLALSAHLAAREHTAALAKSCMTTGVLGDLRIVALLHQALNGQQEDHNAGATTAALIHELRSRLNHDRPARGADPPANPRDEDFWNNNDRSHRRL